MKATEIDDRSRRSTTEAEDLGRQLDGSSASEQAPRVRIPATLLALALWALTGCTAQSVTGLVADEPVCVDFAIGKGPTMMKGSLVQPVELSIVDDDEVRWQRVILGKRTAADPNSRFVVPDRDDTYTLRYAQCSNRFAPRPVVEDTRSSDERGAYHCGEAVVYKEVPLEIREEDETSRVIPWVDPPAPACWTSKTPEAL